MKIANNAIIVYTFYHLPFTIVYIDLSFHLVRLVAPFFLFRNIAQVIGESIQETLNFIGLQGIFPDMSHQRWIIDSITPSITCVYRLIKDLLPLEKGYQPSSPNSFVNLSCTSRSALLTVGFCRASTLSKSALVMGGRRTCKFIDFKYMMSLFVTNEEACS